MGSTREELEGRLFWQMGDKQIYLQGYKFHELTTRLSPKNLKFWQMTGWQTRKPSHAYAPKFLDFNNLWQTCDEQHNRRSYCKLWRVIKGAIESSFTSIIVNRLRLRTIGSNMSVIVSSSGSSLPPNSRRVLKGIEVYTLKYLELCTLSTTWSSFHHYIGRSLVDVLPIRCFIISLSSL